MLALSAAGVAQAQTVVHITGSTAFRTAVHDAILNILQPGFTYGYVGTSFTGAGEAIFTGTAITNNISVIIKTSWSGSLAGIQTVSQAVPATVGTFLTNTTPQSASGTGGAPSNFDPPVIPECCMADGFQYTSQYPTPVLTATTVGIAPFNFVVNAPGAAAGVTNMTPLLAQALWENGSLPLSMFTGNPGDANTIVYATGRDWDSGTRKTALLETGVQTFFSEVLNIQTIYQYEPLGSGGLINKANFPGNNTITSLPFWPVETVDTLSYGVGFGGYSSGGDLAYGLRATSPYILVSYLGLSDTATATSTGSGGNNAKALSYNGIYYSTNTVQNGTYTFWTYEQLDYLPTLGTTDPNAKAVADSLANNLSTNAAAINGVGVLLPTMNVVREQEGGPVTPQ